MRECTHAVPRFGTIRSVFVRVVRVVRVGVYTFSERLRLTALMLTLPPPPSPPTPNRAQLPGNCEIYYSIRASILWRQRRRSAAHQHNVGHRVPVRNYRACPTCSPGRHTRTGVDLTPCRSDVWCIFGWVFVCMCYCIAIIIGSICMCGSVAYGIIYTITVCVNVSRTR